MQKYKYGLRRALKEIKRELLAEAYRREENELNATYKGGYHEGIETARSILDEFARHARRFDHRFEREALQRYFYGDQR